MAAYTYGTRTRDVKKSDDWTFFKYILSAALAASVICGIPIPI